MTGPTLQQISGTDFVWVKREFVPAAHRVDKAWIIAKTIIHPLTTLIHPLTTLIHPLPTLRRVSSPAHFAVPAAQQQSNFQKEKKLDEDEHLI